MTRKFVGRWASYRLPSSTGNKKSGRLGVPNLQRLRELEKENARIKVPQPLSSCGFPYKKSCFFQTNIRNNCIIRALEFFLMTRCFYKYQSIHIACKKNKTSLDLSSPHYNDGSHKINSDYQQTKIV